ncbi:MAG: DUF5915 domain-containing protein, partial [Phycisphaerae bacterium]
DQYVTYEVKANFKSIGPKFGKLAPQIQKALATADAASLRRRLEEAGKVLLEVGGQSVELTAEDVQVALKAKSGWAAAQGRDAVVVLSTEITRELRLECIARELIHVVQSERARHDLPYESRIKIFVNMRPEDRAKGADLLDALQRFRDYILAETLGLDLTLTEEGPPANPFISCHVEGADLDLWIERQG